MQYKPFYHMDDLLSGYYTYIDADAAFLQSGQIPPSLEDKMYRLLQLLHGNDTTNEDAEVRLSISLFKLECMYICYVQEEEERQGMAPP